MGQGQLTSDGALEGAVVVKGNDGDLVGLGARLVPCLLALEAAPDADRDQATQQQEPPEHQHQPAMGGHTELGQKGFVYRTPPNVSDCLQHD